MAALNRPTTANYEVHESVRVDTHDNEDHTFCGILFPIKVKEDLPISQLVLRSVSVRGQLGPMTVWISKEDAPTGPPDASQRRRRGGNNNDNNNNNDRNNNDNTTVRRGSFHFRLEKRYWTKVYERHHAPSMRHYQELDFSDNPVLLKPGTIRAIYIHSQSPGDEAIVYDNTRHSFVYPFGRSFGGGGHWGRRPRHERGHHQHPQPQPRYQDDCLAIYTGKAHLSTTPFGQTNIWGWDNAWRDYREFVGQLQYGTVYQLWQPHARVHTSFGEKFDAAVRTILALQRRPDSPVARLPDECIFYILNMCRWDWFDDTSTKLKQQRRLRRARRQEQEHHQQQQQQRRVESSTAAAAAANAAPSACSASAPPAPPPDGGESMNLSCSSVRQADRSNTATTTSNNNENGTACARSSAPMDHGTSSSNHAMEEDNDDRETSENDDNDDDDEDFETSDDGDDDEDAEMEADDEDDIEYEAVVDDDNANEEEENDSDGDVGDSVEGEEDDFWDRANGYRANPSYLSFRYASSDEEDEDDVGDEGGDGNGNPGEAAANSDDDDEDGIVENRHAWFRRHFARIHILRALAHPENNDEDEGRVVLMHLD